jgi:hypothetical protein
MAFPHKLIISTLIRSFLPITKTEISLPFTEELVAILRPHIYFFKIQWNNILSSKPVSSNWFLFYKFSSYAFIL